MSTVGGWVELNTTTPATGVYGTKIRADGSAACWGWNGQGEATPPAFERLAAADTTTCGLETSGEVVCWGSSTLAQMTPPAGPFVNLTVGADHACATRSDDSSECWGGDWSGSDPMGSVTLPVGQYRQVSAATVSGCRLDVYGQVSCWGGRQFAPPESTFRQIAVSDWYGCGILADGTGACWCWPGDHACEVPAWAGTFTQVAVGNYNVCWLTTAGDVWCSMGSEYPPPGVYQQIATGGYTSCAVREDGTAVCWGDNAYGKATPPAGTFQQLAIGGMHGCGVSASGGLVRSRGRALR